MKTADIDEVTLRRISGERPGGRHPDAGGTRWRGSSSSVDAAKADRYRLRAGDILMPRMLPRHKYTDYMVVNAEYAEQDLASSHNMITIRRGPWTWPKGSA